MGEKGPGVNSIFARVQNSPHPSYINFVQNSTFPHAFSTVITQRRKKLYISMQAIVLESQLEIIKSEYVTIPHKPLRGCEGCITGRNILFLVNAGRW